jgi:hypothetical protein
LAGLRAQDLDLSPEQARRADAAERILGEGVRSYLKSQTIALGAVASLPTLRDQLEPAYIPTVLADIADLPRKMTVESAYQREQTNRCLENLGFARGGGTRIWRDAGRVIRVVESSLLDPNLIRNAFQSPDAQRPDAAAP